MIVAGRFDLTYDVTSLNRFSAAPREVQIKLSKKVFGYLNKNPKRGYAINRQPLTIHIHIGYKKMDLNVDFVNQYSYFREEINDRFPGPLFDELYLSVFVYAYHGHDKVTGRSITGILFMVGSTPTTWSSKRYKLVHTSTFVSKVTALKRAVE